MSKDDDMVARGATLFGSGEKRDKSKSKRKIRKFDEEFFKSRRPQDEHNIKYIIELVQSKGLKLDFYKKKYLIRRTRSRISRANVSSYKEYLEVLKKSPDELQNLKDALSINVTRFFRNGDSWKELREKIIPALVKEKRRNGVSKIKIWSAGCAVGAEPYSLSIIVDSPEFKDIDFTIYASDINQDLLRIARNATYDAPYLDEMNQSEIFEMFDLVSQGTYRVKNRLRERVKFSQIDLTKDRYPKQIDLILCRNVMIYLKRDAQDVIKKKFLSSLNTGGYLVLGRTETLSGKWRGEFDSISVRHRIYKKKSGI